MKKSILICLFVLTLFKFTVATTCNNTGTYSWWNNTDMYNLTFGKNKLYAVNYTGLKLENNFTCIFTKVEYNIGFYKCKIEEPLKYYSQMTIYCQKINNFTIDKSNCLLIYNTQKPEKITKLISICIIISFACLMTHLVFSDNTFIIVKILLYIIILNRLFSNNEYPYIITTN